jgi:hypothetical protein
MKRKSSKDKTRRKRKGLSDKDLVKLLKKLKPQTQQIVRVNVGDKENKKKKGAGEVQTSYNPPFVFPGHPAITHVYHDKPSPPAAPVVAPVEAPAPAPPVEQPVEQLPVLYKLTSSRKKKVNVEPESEWEPSPRFSRPRQTRTSTLGLSSSLPSRFAENPSNNDPYVPYAIDISSSGDEQGTAPQALSSDQWVLTPEGEQPSLQPEAPPPAPIEQSTPEMKMSPQEEALQVFQMAEEPLFPPPPPEPTSQEIQQMIPQAQQELPPLKIKPKKPLPRIPVKEEPLVTTPMIRDAPNLSAYLMKSELEDAISNGYPGVPNKYLSTRNPGKLKSGISKSEMRDLYNNLIEGIGVA